jgi:hypothetical protein
MKVENGARICGWLKPAKRPRVNEWLPMNWSCAASAASATFQVSNAVHVGSQDDLPLIPHHTRCAAQEASNQLSMLREVVRVIGEIEKAKTIRS